MQCNYILANNDRCRILTYNKTGYCHIHKSKYPKPNNCIICYSSLHQTQRPLDCGHWVHRKCIKKTEKAECPICKTPVSDVDPEDIHSLLDQINENALLFAVILFQMYAFLTNPNNRTLGLEHFIECIIPENIRNRDAVFTMLYIQALQIFFH